MGRGRCERAAREAGTGGDRRYFQRSPWARRQVCIRRYPPGRVPELSHANAQWVQPADQLEYSRQAPRPGQRRKTQGSDQEVISDLGGNWGQCILGTHPEILKYKNFGVRPQNTLSLVSSLHSPLQQLQQQSP